MFCLSSSCVLCIVVSNTYCVVFVALFVFVLCLVYPAFPVSLDYPFLVALSVFSNIYFKNNTRLLGTINFNKTGIS